MISSYIINILHIPLVTIKVLRDLHTQKKFIARHLQPILLEFQAVNNSTPDIDYKRITNYYALAVSAIIGETHCTLHRKAMTTTERRAGTLIGACSVLFDDFFDNSNLTDEYITQLINNPKNIEPTNNSVKLAIQLYSKLLEGIQYSENIQQALNDVFQEQVRSKKQKNSDLAEEEIRDITFTKGGTAFLLYRKAFGEISTRCEEKFYYTLGAIMQLENDIFDVYKDRQEGIRTLVTACHDIKPVRNLYLYLINELFEGAQQLPVNPKAVAKAMRVLMLVICRGLVCLDQLENLQKSTNNRFELMAYSRSELICDMEKPTNFMKMIHYYANYQY